MSKENLLILALVVTGVLGALRWDLLKLFWRDLLKLAAPPVARLAPPQVQRVPAGPRPRVSATRALLPQRPTYHRSGRRQG